MVVDYRPEPFTNFQDETNRQQFEAALNQVEKELGKEYPLIINGERIMTQAKIQSVNPSRKNQVVGSVAKANQELADQALKAAADKFEEWKAVPGDHRARYLFKAAAILRRRKHEFSAWLVYEAGKSWAEADADTAEAIDFMEFYAREMVRLSERQPLTRLPGEDNELYYIPLGVGVVIPPWNFPLAIMVGMTTASLVAGNTVVLKPASTTPVVAAKFMEILEEAGLPDGGRELSPWKWWRSGRLPRRTSAYALYFLYRFTRRWTSYPRISCQTSTRTKMVEACRRRDGRKGYDRC